MAVFDKIDVYYALPQPVKSAVVGLTGLVKARKKYGNLYQEHFKFLTNSDGAKREKRAEEELGRFLQETVRKNRFYERLHWGEWTPGAMPIIDKSVVLAHYRDLAAPDPFAVGRSSGSSGQPLAVPYSKSAYQKEYAFWWYHRSFGGVSRGERVATFAGHKIADVRKDTPPFWVHNCAENQLFLSSYHLSPANLPHYVTALNDYKPVFLHGYPSSLYLLANHILENGIRIRFKLKMVVASSETLLQFQRDAIEKALGCKVYVWYGNTELCGHITECEQGRLHVQPYHSLVRVLKEDGSDARPGEVGRVVATNFTNTAFPLVNYDMKDAVRVSEIQTCPCERGGPIVDYVLGRVEDYIVTPEGRFVGRLDHLLKDASNVRNAQIVQDEVERIRMRIDAAPGYSRDVEGAILHEARIRLGDSIRVEFEYVDEIPKDPSGKFRFVVQNIRDTQKIPGRAGRVPELQDCGRG